MRKIIVFAVCFVFTCFHAGVATGEPVSISGSGNKFALYNECRPFSMTVFQLGEELEKKKWEHAGFYMIKKTLRANELYGPGRGEQAIEWNGSLHVIIELDRDPLHASVNIEFRKELKDEMTGISDSMVTWRNTFERHPSLLHGITPSRLLKITSYRLDEFIREYKKANFRACSKKGLNFTKVRFKFTRP